VPDGATGASGPRHEARERAVALLYEAEMKKVPIVAVLDELALAPDPFTERLLRGIAGRVEEIDGLVASAAVGWEVERMPVVDRAVLRLATYELLAESEVPVAVVIDEAVELAKQYSTEESGRFVNGVLATLAGRLRA
jgi:N utilization substance protein B